MRILGALLAFVLLVAGAAIAYMYSGFYNVAATDPHNAVVRWALDTTTVRSIEQHAQGIDVPDSPASTAFADAMAARSRHNA